MICGKVRLAFISLFILSFQSKEWCGKIVYPLNATAAIVKAGEALEVWFDADAGYTMPGTNMMGSCIFYEGHQQYFF